jgi:hypothetical protein
MMRADQLQEIAALSPPILSVYLNTRAQNASRHPQLQPCQSWLKKEAVSILRGLRTLDAERFGRQVMRVERSLASDADSEG